MSFSPISVSLFLFLYCHFLLLYVSPPLLPLSPTFHFAPNTHSHPHLSFRELGVGWGMRRCVSDSYKILIGTRNMIAREKGGWNWEKLCLRNANYFLSLLRYPCLSGSLSSPHVYSFIFFFLNLLPSSCSFTSLPTLLSSDLLTEWITDPNSPPHKRLAWMLSSVMDGCSRTMSRFDLRHVVNMHRGQNTHFFPCSRL